VGNRVDPRAELTGLDLTLHGETAYSDDGGPAPGPPAPPAARPAPPVPVPTAGGPRG
jgi:hypothetical protein